MSTPFIRPASEITKAESVAEVREASRAVEAAFGYLNLLIQREQERGELESQHGIQ
jgi:hypothetical protein